MRQQQGVVTTHNTSTKQDFGTPNTIKQGTTTFHCTVYGYDKDGVGGEQTYVVVGRDVFYHPGAKEWTRDLRKVPDGIANQVRAEFDRQMERMFNHYLKKVGLLDVDGSPVVAGADPVKRDVALVAPKVSGDAQSQSA